MYKQALKDLGKLDEWGREPYYKTLRDSPYEYTYFVEHCLLPSLEEKRNNKQLSKIS